MHWNEVDKSLRRDAKLLLASEQLELRAAGYVLRSIADTIARGLANGGNHTDSSKGNET